LNQKLNCLLICAAGLWLTLGCGVASTANHALPDSGTTVPIILTADGKAYIDAMINGKGPFTLLIDSGSELMAMTPEAVQRCGLTVHTGRLAVQGTTGGYVEVHQAEVHTVQIGGVTIRNPVCSVEKMDFHCDGLIGEPLFDAAVLKLDLANGLLTMYPNDTFKAAKGQLGVPIKFGSHRTPVVQGSIGGIRARLQIDTGSAFPVELLPAFVQSHNLTEQFGRLGEIKLNSVGGTSFSQIYDIKALCLGSKLLNDRGYPVPAVFLNPGFAAADFDARIGSPMLAGAVVTFDYRRGRLYLRPRQLATASLTP